MTKQTEGQLMLFDPGIWSGKMSPEPSPAQMVRISGRCLKKPAELLTVPYLYLDLRAGYGNLLGPYWDKNSPLLGEYTTLNTGPSHKGAGAFSLSRILETAPHPKYYGSNHSVLRAA